MGGSTSKIDEEWRRMDEEKIEETKTKIRNLENNKKRLENTVRELSETIVRKKAEIKEIEKQSEEKIKNITAFGMQLCNQQQQHEQHQMLLQSLIERQPVEVSEQLPETDVSTKRKHVTLPSKRQVQNSMQAKPSTSPSQATILDSNSPHEQIENPNQSILQSSIESAQISGTEKKHLQNLMNVLPTEYDKLVMLLQHMVVRIDKIFSRQEVLIKFLEKHDFQNNPQSVPSTSSFAESHKLQLPLKTIEDFQNFDLKLKQKNCRDDFKKTIVSLLDPENILTRSLINIYKKYLSRDLAMSFTMSRQMPGKHVLQGTEFATCIQDFFISTNSDQSTEKKITASKMNTLMGTVLGYAKDWNGKVRPNKSVLPGPKILTGQIVENIEILYEEPLAAV